MFTSLPEWLVFFGIVVGVYYLMKPIQRRLARRIARALSRKYRSKSQATIIDITPLKKKSEKESRDYEN